MSSTAAQSPNGARELAHTHAFQAAVVQAEPVWDDLDQAVEKTVALSAEPAGRGARLVAFPEVWIPGYPWFLWLDSVAWQAQFLPTTYLAHSMTRDGAPFARTAWAAAKHEIAVSFGFSEHDGALLYIAQAHIDAAGVARNVRRELKPTHVERTLFGEADGSDITVVDTELARVGALNCWEHLQPLVKFAMFSQGEPLRVAARPGFSIIEDAVYALGPEVNVSAARQYAVEGQAFVLSPCGVVGDRALALFVDTEVEAQLLRRGGGHARNFGPDASPCVHPPLPDCSPEPPTFPGDPQPQPRPGWTPLRRKPHMALIPLNLLMSHDGKSNRRPITCRFRCADACGHPAPNRSDNEYFGDVVRRSMSRRSVLQASAVTVLAVGTTSVLAACGSGEDAAAPSSTVDAAADAPRPGMVFSAVAPNTEDAVVVPEGYSQGVVISWGDPVLPGAPAFDIAKQSGAAQRGQFGFNNDFAALMPIAGAAGRFLLVTNHEYTTDLFMFPDHVPEAPTREHFEIGIAAHGMTVVEVERVPGAGLRPVMGRYNRRITADTPFTLVGPGAGTALTTTAGDPSGRTVLGTFANCAGGVTPWGTVLSGEENFHGYFGGTEGAPAPSPVVGDRWERYGLEVIPSERRWEQFDPRFDLAANPNEANRFGYIVELNPWDPTSTPVKHTALGRFKHEGATIHVTADGTVVAYSGDDERFDYMYKFVSSRKVTPGAPTDAAAMERNMGILGEGTLYVAKLSSDIPGDEIDGSGTAPAEGRFAGTGTWMPLLRVDPDGRATSLVDGIPAEEVAVFTRFAADKAGATKMDRPEDFEANPVTGKVYVALTNNNERGAPGEAPADAANPRNDNKSGQILEIDDDHAGTRFTWNLLLVCGDPAAADTYFGGFDKGAVSPISCPDNLAFDSHGNLWISTDGNALDSNDGLFAVALEGPRRGETKQFLTVPIGAETCGPVVTDDLVTVCVQHPGENDENSLADPLSRWPEGGNGTAKPSVVAVWRTDGAAIGL